MKEKAFNLLDEPWIRLMRPDCGVDTLSLTDALTRAQEYRALAGELATQDAALIRLLLAVLHAVFYRVDADGAPAPVEELDDALERWAELWKLGRFPEAPIRAYLERWRERFWLFHPDRPFYQTPIAAKGTEYSAAKLNGELAESGNKVRLFAAANGAIKEAVPFDAAARWLLYANAFDDTSSKPSVRKADLPSPGAGWLGKLGLIWAEGANLFETLMLNLVMAHDRNECWGEPRPAWELDMPREGERTEIAMPDNQAELLTLQSRRLLLRAEGELVTGYSLLGGDFFEKINATAEQMTLWRHVEAKGSEPAYNLPRRHDPTRQLWRDFADIAIQGEGRLPGVTRWIALLKSCGILNRKRMVSFRTASVQYGDKDFFVTDVFQDRLDFHAGLLTDAGRAWADAVQREIALCDRAASLVGTLATRLDKAGGGAGEESARYAKETFYAKIDAPFRTWLANINPEDAGANRDALCEDWRREANKIALTLGRGMVAQAGDAAFAGRTITEKVNGKTTANRYSSPEAYIAFQRGIRKCWSAEAVKEAVSHG